VIRYLVAAQAIPACSYDIGGVDLLTYEEMMKRYASLTGRRRFVLKVPALIPGLSSLWFGLVTDGPGAGGRHVTRPLAEGLCEEVIVTDQRIRSLIPFEALGFDNAVRAAIAASSGRSGVRHAAQER